MIEALVIIGGVSAMAVGIGGLALARANTNEIAISRNEDAIKELTTDVGAMKRRLNRVITDTNDEMVKLRTNMHNLAGDVKSFGYKFSRRGGDKLEEPKSVCYPKKEGESKIAAEIMAGEANKNVVVDCSVEYNGSEVYDKLRSDVDEIEEELCTAVQRYEQRTNHLDTAITNLREATKVTVGGTKHANDYCLSLDKRVSRLEKLQESDAFVVVMDNLAKSVTESNDE